MKFIPLGDYHLHTLYSDGRASIEEMARAAQSKGLQEIAITDHGPRNFGTGVKNAAEYLKIKKEVRRVEAACQNLRIYAGAEANVISRNGEIDIPREVLNELDLLLIGLHPYAVPLNAVDLWQFTFKNIINMLCGFFNCEAIEINTKALRCAIERYRPYAICHPGLGMPVDIEKIAATCADHGTFFEINAGHKYLSPLQIKSAAKTGVSFIVNSDAHYTDSVGNLAEGIRILEEAGIPAERIVNIEN